LILPTVNIWELSEWDILEARMLINRAYQSTEQLGSK